MDHMGMMLTYRPGYWKGTPAEPVEPQSARAKAEPDAYDDLSDEQVAEAYAVNVGGNATSRKGQLRALRKLDADTADVPTAKPGDGQPGEDEQETPEGEQPAPENQPDPADEPTQPAPENTPGE